METPRHTHTHKFLRPHPASTALRPLPSLSPLSVSQPLSSCTKTRTLSISSSLSLVDKKKGGALNLVDFHLRRSVSAAIPAMRVTALVLPCHSTRKETPKFSVARFTTESTAVFSVQLRRQSSGRAAAVSPRGRYCRRCTESGCCSLLSPLHREGLLFAAAPSVVVQPRNITAAPD